MLWCRGCFDIDEDEDNETIGTQAHTTKEEDTAAQISSLPRHVISEQKKYSSGSILPEGTFSPKKTSSDAERLASSKHYFLCLNLFWHASLVLKLLLVRDELILKASWLTSAGIFNSVNIKQSGATVDHCIALREILVTNLPSLSVHVILVESSIWIPFMQWTRRRKRRMWSTRDGLKSHQLIWVPRYITSTVFYKLHFCWSYYSL